LRRCASCRTRLTCQVACALECEGWHPQEGADEASEAAAAAEAKAKVASPVPSNPSVARVCSRPCCTSTADGSDPVQGATKAAKTAEKAAEKPAVAETASAAHKAATAATAAMAAAAYAEPKPKAAEEVAHRDWCMHYGTRTSTAAFVDTLSDPCASAPEHALARALQPSASEARADASL
jgi:hypothetical protein